MLQILPQNIPTSKIASQLWRKAIFLLRLYLENRTATARKIFYKQTFFTIYETYNIYIYTGVHILNLPTSKSKGWLWKLVRPCPENRAAPNNFSLTSGGFTFGGEIDLVWENHSLTIFVSQYTHLWYWSRTGWKQKILHSSHTDFPQKKTFWSSTFIKWLHHTFGIGTNLEPLSPLHW